MFYINLSIKGRIKADVILKSKKACTQLPACRSGRDWVNESTCDILYLIWYYKGKSNEILIIMVICR